MELGALGSLHAVDRPDAAALLERVVVARVPVAASHDEVEPVRRRQLVHARGDLVAALDAERATWREVVLEVDDD